MSGLNLFVLGPPRLERYGQQVKVERRKALALLIYLAATGQDQRRDTLAVLFWPEYDQTSARAALRRTLFSLNKVLGPDLVDANREWIGLRSMKRRSGLWLDADRFHDLLAESRKHVHKEGETCPDCIRAMADACDLYRDDFLTGFSLRDAPDFDNWQLFQGEILRRELTETLECLVEGYSAQSNFERAIVYAHRWMTLDPFSESAHYHLIRLYAWSGQRQAAIRQYHQCVLLLERELGVAPLASTTELYQAVKSNTSLPILEQFSALESSQEPKHVKEVPPDSVRFPAPTPATLSMFQKIDKGQLIGREHELAVMETVWKQTVSGERQALLVSGEAGIGKTRLVLKFLQMVESQGAIVFTGRCDAMNRVPYAPIAQIIRNAFDYFYQKDFRIPAYILADLLNLTPQLRARYPQIPPNPTVEPLFEQQRLYDSFVSWCDELARNTPILMQIEDIHWADSGTLQLLNHLMFQMHTGRLLLIMTYRGTELDIAEERTFQQVLENLYRERQATFIKLPRLNQEQTRDLLGAILKTGGEISTEFLESIYRETEGNPFYIEEVCKALIEEGKLFYAGGTWRRSDIQSIVIPKTVRAAILSRVAKLSHPQQEMLRLAAVLGHEFDFTTLHKMSAWDEVTLEDLLERASQAQFLQEVSRGGTLRFTFAHALIPFALRESMSGLHLQRLHHRAASIIQAQRPDDYEVLAYHYTASGEQEKAISFMLQAAQWAESLYAFDSALQYLYSALNLTVSSKDQSMMRLAILEQLADIQCLRGERTEAILHYQEALDLWRSEASADKWIAVRLHRKVGETFLRLNTSADIERFAVVSQTSLEIGLKLTVDEPPHPETVRLLTTLANDAWEARTFQDWDAAEGYARAAIEMIEQLDLPVELSNALDALSTIYGVRGLYRERVELALRRLTLSRDPRFNDKREHCNILCQTGNALILVGEFAQALSFLLEAESLAGQIHDVNLETYALGLQAQCLYGLDRWDEMLQIEGKRQSLVGRYGSDRVGRMCFYCGLSANVSALRGEYGQAHYWREIAYNLMAKAWGGPPEKWSGVGHY
jgi:DNA-binding SARP family transcriptional activator